ncbi:pentapeptide repeat-containing protein [Streptomyces cyaneus]|uniref:pentapeptide repeat-containing protein n=1 Tax=Streptomyces cyaneus TaxID=1904 RepID=UPI000FF89BEE|nr:pentapeptide repeat-containing protein [Streptomyces cyaneus]
MQVSNEQSITQEGQITDRYNNAVGNLAGDTADIRLGGIYALQRIMKDSAKDQPAVIEVLSGYVRVQTDPAKLGKELPPKPEADVGAALQVLRNRDETRDGDGRIDLSNSHLADADLYGADLDVSDMSGANLTGAVLTLAELERASLAGAKLMGASLDQAHMHETILVDAHLKKADLSYAELPGAYLQEADLSYASLYKAELAGADLRDATLTCADLSGAVFTDPQNPYAGFPTVTLEQLLSARIDFTTVLPHEFAGIPELEARMRAVAADGDNCSKQQ